MGNKRTSSVFTIVLVLCLLVMMISLLTGCSGAPGMTSKAVDRRHIQSLYTDWLLFQEDVDALLMIDRPSRLTPIYTR